METASHEQLDAYLHAHSYLGSDQAATLYDFKVFAAVLASSVSEFPHLKRWHAHMVHLWHTFGDRQDLGDHLGRAFAEGVSPFANLATRHSSDEQRRDVGGTSSPQAAAAAASAAPEAISGQFRLLPKPESVSIWGGVPAFVFTAVLPFYSHTIKSKEWKRVDQALDIDRRVFSNLWVEPDGQQFRVPVAPESMGGCALMRHAFLAEKPSHCSEAFFQAAKCELEADARFAMTLSEMDVAKYGQGRLDLSEEQVRQLKILGLDVEVKAKCPNAAYKGQDAEKDARRIPPRRTDWEDVKMDVMLHVCRHKFGIAPSATAQSSVASRSMATLAASAHSWLLVEHPRPGGDRLWGDGGDGAGANMLGKCLGQIVREARGAPVASRLTSFTEVRALNNTIVEYVSS